MKNQDHDFTVCQGSTVRTNLVAHKTGLFGFPTDSSINFQKFIQILDIHFLLERQQTLKNKKLECSGPGSLRVLIRVNPPKPHLAYESSVCRNTIKILLPVKNPTESHLRGAKDDLVVLN